ncbi:hypothetical protein [Bradyrhizobium sp. USDA 4341]
MNRSFDPSGTLKMSWGPVIEDVFEVVPDVLAVAVPDVCAKATPCPIVPNAIAVATRITATLARARPPPLPRDLTALRGNRSPEAK